MQGPSIGDSFNFTSSFIIATQQRGKKLPKCVSRKQCVGISGGSLRRELHAFPNGSTCRRAGRKTRLIAVLTEIHKRDRSYQA